MEDKNESRTRWVEDNNEASTKGVLEKAKREWLKSLMWQSNRRILLSRFGRTIDVFKK
jgi:hypothetical protein